MSDSRQPQIIAMGGGGFSMAPDNPLLDHYVLAQLNVDQPKVCFIGTASGDSTLYLTNFYHAFSGMGCRPTHLPLFRRTPDLRALIMSQDLIYVGGGNTKSMLAVWREYGLDLVLREAWEAGIVLAGISAGAICWFEYGLTDSAADGMLPLPGLGFLPGACSPHYDSETDRPAAFQKLLSDLPVEQGIALDDFAAVHYIGRDRHRVISSRPHAQGYLLQKKGQSIAQQTLDTHHLLPTT